MRVWFEEQLHYWWCWCFLWVWLSDGLTMVRVRWSTHPCGNIHPRRCRKNKIKSEKEKWENPRWETRLPMVRWWRTRSLRDSVLQQSWHSYFSLRKQSLPSVQWCSPLDCPNHQICHGLSGRIQTCCSVHHSSWNDSTSPNPYQHGLATTQISSPNWQLYCCRGYQQHYCSSTEQNDGHEILVAPLPWIPRPVSILLRWWL